MISNNENKVILEIKNLSVGKKLKNKDIKIIDDLSLSVRENEIVGIAGESGCGKSMLCKAILGILPGKIEILSGSIKFDGKEIDSTKKLKAIRGSEINMIFQEPVSALHPLKKVGKQIGESLKLHSNLNSKEIKERVIETMVSVGINDAEKRYNQYPHQLSGGLCQRVVIAMAIINKPKLLIADEPTTALDVTVQARVLNLIKRLQETTGTSVIFISHDLAVLSQLANRINVMYCGQIVEENLKKEIFKNPYHPYTKDLIRAIPEIGKKDLQAIKGSVPLPEDYPSLCKYKDRCQEKFAKCDKEKPCLYAKESGKIRCLKYE